MTSTPTKASPEPDRRTERRSRHGLLHRNAAWLMANTVATGGLGFLFWAVAAHLFSPAAVGRQGALVNMMLGLSAIGTLNLSVVITRFLPAARSPNWLITRAYAAGCGATALLVMGVLLVGNLVGSDALGTQHKHGLELLFIVSAACWTIFVLQDGVLAALRASLWVAVENAAFGVAKIALLIPFAGMANGIFAAWVIPMIVLLVPVNAYVLLHTKRRPRAPADAPALDSLGRTGIRRFLAMEFGAALVTQMSGTLLPVLVVAVVGDAAAASFYIPLLIVLTIDALVLAWMTSLTVEAAHDESAAAAMVRSVTKRSALLMAVVVPVTVVAAPLLLFLFGSHYTSTSTGVLRLLVLASPFKAVLALYATIARIRGHGMPILVSQAAVVPLLVAGTVVLGGWYGVLGIGYAWLGSNAAVAVMVLPFVVRDLRWTGARHPAAESDVVPAVDSLKRTPAPLPEGLIPASTPAPELPSGAVSAGPSSGPDYRSADG